MDSSSISAASIPNSWIDRTMTGWGRLGRTQLRLQHRPTSYGFFKSFRCSVGRCLPCRMVQRHVRLRDPSRIAFSSHASGSVTYFPSSPITSLYYHSPAIVPLDESQVLECHIPYVTVTCNSNNRGRAEGNILDKAFAIEDIGHGEKQRSVREGFQYNVLRFRHSIPRPVYPRDSSPNARLIVCYVLIWTLKEAAGYLQFQWE